MLDSELADQWHVRLGLIGNEVESTDFRMLGHGFEGVLLLSLLIILEELLHSSSLILVME